MYNVLLYVYCSVAGFYIIINSFIPIYSYSCRKGMPKWKSNFNPNWLHNPEFSTWLVHRDDSSAHCKLCEKTFSITTLGISALRSHAKGVKHKDKISQQKQSTTVLDFFAHSKNESTTSAISEPV